MKNSPNRVLAVVVGAGYVLIGILGFTVTAGVDFFATEGGLLFGVLSLNPFQNVVHILIGAVLIVAGLSSVAAAKTVNGAIGALCLVLGLAGLFLIGTPANILAINVADNVLHFATSVVLLAAGLGADKTARSAPAAAH